MERRGVTAPPPESGATRNMATKAKRKLALEQPLLDAPKGDWHDLADRISENPLLYVGAVLFVIVAALAGWLIRVYQTAANQEFATEFARALEADDEAAVITALEPLANEKQEALYMLGETAFEAGDFEAAKNAFTRLREEHSNSPHVPDAVEGLGFIAENNGEYDEAKRHYKDIMDNWPESFAAKRQQFNIGRCEEAAGNNEAAIDAYRAQTLAFPNSRVANRASAMMTQLQAELGIPETEADNELESALNAVLENAKETEEPAATEAEITEMPEEPEVTEAAPAIDSQKLELNLPAPGEGAGATDEATDTADTP